MVSLFLAFLIIFWLSRQWIQVLFLESSPRLCTFLTLWLQPLGLLLCTRTLPQTHFAFSPHFVACSNLLVQAATSASRKSIFSQAGQISSNSLCQGLPVSLEAHQSPARALPGYPCCRVLVRLDIFMDLMPYHNKRNYWGLHGYKSWPGK